MPKRPSQAEEEPSHKVYRDRADENDGNPTCWQHAPFSQAPEVTGQWCQFPQDHTECFVSPAVLHVINRTRRTINDSIPEINFYAFVQHEGETTYLKPGIWYMTVSVGQCYGVSHNFVRPRDAETILEDKQTQTRCTCPDGGRRGGKDNTHIDLRVLEDADQEGDQGGRDGTSGDEMDEGEGQGGGPQVGSNNIGEGNPGSDDMDVEE